MIVQITIARNEYVLIKELLPIWKTYTDGFVFMLDRNTDNTRQYLESVRDEFNILDILEVGEDESTLPIETDKRRLLFDVAKQYSNKIICLDADEYLDGQMTKEELSTTLDNYPDTLILLQWLQYTSATTVRVDEPWTYNLKDRVGSYVQEVKLFPAQMHSQHLPVPSNQLILPKEILFIAHLPWLNKTHSAIKQYFWKVEDYVNSTLYGSYIIGYDAYDASVNNFKWEESHAPLPLKVSPSIFDETAIQNNYRLDVIKERIKKYSIPDLGSWGYDFLSMGEIATSAPKISVITAIGDNELYEKYIARWLSNAKKQDMFEYTEHIIVYKEWSSEFEHIGQLPNFKLIKQTDTGVYNAWNIGIKVATTPYVTFWNIDDVRHPSNNRLKFETLEHNPDISLVYSWFVATDDPTLDFENSDTSDRNLFTVSSEGVEYPENIHEVILYNCFAGPDPMWRKSLHDVVGYFDNNQFATIGDWEMWIRFVFNANAKFKLIPQTLCIYLDHKNTVSNRQQNQTDTERHTLHQTYQL
jgi:hypothetical protein